MTMLCCAANFFEVRAQTVEPQIKIVEAEIIERLEGGDVVIRIGGVKYRAVTAANVRRLAERKVEFENALEELKIERVQKEKLLLAIATTARDTTLANEQITLERNRADKYLGLYQAERDLRLTAGKPPKTKNAFEKFLGHPVVQIGIVVIGAVAARSAK